jgi:hypothetical protein
MTDFHKNKTKPAGTDSLCADGFNIRFVRGTRNQIRGSLWITLKQLRSS